MLCSHRRLVCILVASALSATWAPLASNAQDVGTTLVQVSFSKIDYIYTGELASFTSTYQRLRFRVQAREVRRTQTGEVLWSGEAVIVLQNRALREDDEAHSTQYCLDIVRSLAVNPNPDLEMTMFLNAWSFGDGPAIVVRTIQSCSLQAPPA